MEKEIIKKFMTFLEKMPTEIQENFKKEFSKIAPTDSFSVVEWQKRYHLQDDHRLQVGAYIYVKPAQNIENTDFETVLGLFLANRTDLQENFWEMLDILESQMIEPFALKMGLALYIAQEHGAFMFHFSAAATPEIIQKFEL